MADDEQVPDPVTQAEEALDAVVDSEAVEAEVVEIGNPGMNSGPKPIERTEEMNMLTANFTPYIMGGTLQEANAWAKFYGLMPQQYRMVRDASGLNGMQPGRDFVVLVGSYRQNLSWETCEAVQYVGQIGIKVTFGGAYPFQREDEEDVS